MDSAEEAEGFEALCNWARERKITMSTINVCKELGFTSIDAIECLSKNDLCKSSIPIGQQRLLLKAVAGTSKVPDAGLTSGDRGPTELASNSEVPRNEGDVNVNVNPIATSASSQSTDGEDAFIRKLVQQLGGNTLSTQPLGGNPTLLQGGNAVPAMAPPITGMFSWQDPQVFLKSSMGSKTSFYNIVDFVDINQVASDKIVSLGDNLEFVYKTGPRKPKLEDLTLTQWSGANLAILYRLVQEGTLPMDNIFDYLSYTANIYNLVSSHERCSVFLYDREYRRLQATHKFRWGTCVGHLAQGFLRLRNTMAGSNPAQSKSKYSKNDKIPTRGNPYPFDSHTSEGKVICKNFNTKYGCNFSGCKFAHVCNVPKCGKPHPGVSHSAQEAKN